MKKKYFTEEERKAARKDYNKRYYDKNKEQLNQHSKEYQKRYYDHSKEYQKRYNKTQMGRAVYLVNGYNREDKKHYRGKGDLTAKWIVEYIFTKPCAHCGKEGWQIIGCNRLDNSKPHTMDNVEPCCFDCNRKLGGGRPRKQNEELELVF